MPRKFNLQHSEDFYLKKLFGKVRVREIMTPRPVTVLMDEPFAAVPKKFRKFGIRHLPVVDEAGRLAGLMSQRDLFRLAPPKVVEGEFVYDPDLLNGIILRHVMIANPVFVGEDAVLGEALMTFVERKIGCLPVVNRDKILTGILTQSDILAVACQIYLE